MSLNFALGSRNIEVTTYIITCISQNRFQPINHCIESSTLTTSGHHNEAIVQTHTSCSGITIYILLYNNILSSTTLTIYYHVTYI